MKNISKLKYLPALLVAPILALCITGFAMASEAEGNETFFETVINNIFINHDNSNNDTNITALDETDFMNARFGTASSDNKFNFNTYVNAKGETVAYLSGIRSGMLSDTDFINNTLIIPMSVFDSTGAEYHVEGVESNSFCGNNIMPLSEDDIYRNHIKNIVINGYTDDGNGG